MIVKMKKLRVIAMADDRERLFDGLLRLGCLQIGGRYVRRKGFQRAQCVFHMVYGPP